MLNSPVTEEAVYVLGAGGHAKVVCSALRAQRRSIAAIFDDRLELRGQLLDGIPIVGPIAEIPDTSDSICIVAIGDNAKRRAVAGLFRSVRWTNAIHPHSWVDPTATLGPGSVVFAGAVVQASAIVGHHVIVNSGAIIEHDCVLGDFVHLGPGSRLAGAVSVGPGAMLGVGSSVIPGKRIGEWSVLGAGAVLVSDLPDGVTALGVPARVYR